jgi:hypothetical protein
MICTECMCCCSICTCDNPITEPACYCEKCGTICTEDILDINGFCEECEEASLEYEETMVDLILAGVSQLIENKK